MEVVEIVWVGIFVEIVLEVVIKVVSINYISSSK